MVPILCVVIEPIPNPFTGEEGLPKGRVLKYDPIRRRATEMTQEGVVYVETDKEHPHICLCMKSLWRIAEISPSTGIVTPKKNEDGTPMTMFDDDDADYDDDDTDYDDDDTDGYKEYYDIQ